MIERKYWIRTPCPRCGAAAGVECRSKGVTQQAPHRQRADRARDERSFWAWVDEQVRATGRTEQKVLDSVKAPGWTGLKARTQGPGESGGRGAELQIGSRRRCGMKVSYCGNFGECNGRITSI